MHYLKVLVISLLGSFLLLATPSLDSSFVYHDFAALKMQHWRDVLRENSLKHDITCLAKNIYFEARSESLLGQRAVAQVTVNRFINLRANSICDIVYAPGQFSWTVKPKRPINNKRVYATAVKIAKAFLVYGKKEPTVGNALFYHANYVKPYWTKHKRCIAVIGNHLFYE